MADILKYLATETSIGRRLTDGFLRPEDNSSTSAFEQASVRRRRRGRSTAKVSNEPLSKRSSGAGSGSPYVDGLLSGLVNFKPGDVEVGQSFSNLTGAPGKRRRPGLRKRSSHQRRSDDDHSLESVESKPRTLSPFRRDEDGGHDGHRNPRGLHQHPPHTAKQERHGRGHSRRRSERKWKATVDEGTPYDISPTHLRLLQDNKHFRSALMIRPPTTNSQEAFTHLRHSLSQPLTPSQYRARTRLQTAYTIPTTKTTPDLYIKAFPDLDHLLFNDILHGKVHLAWASLNKPTSLSVSRLRDPDLLQTLGRTHPMSFFGRPVQILLDKAHFERDHKSLVWETLVHEMLHAWEFVSIRPRVFARTHGSEFWDALLVLMERMGFEGLDGRSDCGGDEGGRAGGRGLEGWMSGVNERAEKGVG